MRRTWGAMWPMTPFWPWRLLNLSPSSGRRVLRASILMTICVATQMRGVSP